MPKIVYSSTNLEWKLREGAEVIGLSLDQGQLARFAKFLSVLLEWNSRVNLTSIRDPDFIIRRHFLDSLTIVRFLSPSGRLLDVGSGAGFPGIPISILFPKKEVLLLEPRRKRANFLREVNRQLDLKNSRVIEERLENVGLRSILSVTEIICRAFGKPEEFLHVSAKLLDPKGLCLIMHGPAGRNLFSRLNDFAGQIGFRQNRLETFTLPLGMEERTVLIFSKL